MYSLLLKFIVLLRNTISLQIDEALSALNCKNIQITPAFRRRIGSSFQFGINEAEYGWQDWPLQI
ncbi:hypothetical protein CAP42_04900 [Acinetobacter indicus]|nr:hypothetical protein VH96_10840 [Acinetobacter indicus]OUY10697.1 hypothetical protein CAP42_04900 [Acinetobacter indicus]